MVNKKLVYKDRSFAHILTVDKIEKYDKNIDGYYCALDHNKEYYKISGEFFYCGLVIEGALLANRNQFQDIIEKMNLYEFSPEYIIKNLNRLNIEKDFFIKELFYFKHISTDYEDPDDEDSDEYMIFIIVEE